MVVMCGYWPYVAAVSLAGVFLCLIGFYVISQWLDALNVSVRNLSRDLWRVECAVYRLSSVAELLDIEE